MADTEQPSVDQPLEIDDVLVNNGRTSNHTNTSGGDEGTPNMYGEDRKPVFRQPEVYIISAPSYAPDEPNKARGRGDKRRLCGCFIVLLFLCVAVAVALVLMYVVGKDTSESVTESVTVAEEITTTKTILREEMYFQGSFSILTFNNKSLVFIEAYQDPSSKEYIEIAEFIERMLNDSYSSSNISSDFLYGKVLSIRNGSIIVDFELVFNTNEDVPIKSEKVKQILKASSMKDTSMMTIDQESLKVEVYIPTTTVTATITTLNQTTPVVDTHPISQTTGSSTYYSTSQLPEVTERRTTTVLSQETTVTSSDKSTQEMISTRPMTSHTPSTIPTTLPGQSTVYTEISRGSTIQVTTSTIPTTSSGVHTTTLTSTPPPPLTMTTTTKPATGTTTASATASTTVTITSQSTSSVTATRKPVTMTTSTNVLDTSEAITPLRNISATGTTTTEMPLTTTEGGYSTDAVTMTTASSKTTTIGTVECNPFFDFACANGRECIFKRKKCDNVEDCSDGSDEQECDQLCEEDEFLCKSSFYCIPGSQRCDMIDDCGDRSDEVNCTCDDETQFRCVIDGSCIPKYYQCDDLMDCEDESDELNCHQLCTETQTMCRDRTCIPRSSLCDGNADCHENEDELTCVAFTGPVVHDTGLVSVKIGDNMLPLCADKLTDVVADLICKQMGYRKSSGFVELPVESLGITIYNFAVLKTEITDANSWFWMSRLVREGPECPSNNVTYVQCVQHECGTRPAMDVASNRIVGGVQSHQGEWPWQVSLEVKGTGHTCGASLLSKEWVVTAAHCFVNQLQELVLDPWLYTMKFGTIHLNGGQNTVKRRARQIFIHPDYNPTKDDYDIAMIKISEAVDFSDYIQPICLPENNTNFMDGTECFVSGWGATVEDGGPSNDLSHVMIPVVSNEECDSLLPNANITTRMLCAGHLAGGRDSCQGDSGGPFVCEKEPDKWVLTGVVSFGNGCARPNSPGVYSRVTEYLDFIHYITEVVGGGDEEDCDINTEFKCFVEGLCIPVSFVCDDAVDCEDASDEMYCSEIPCYNDTGFQCIADRSCIPLSFVCDGYSDCNDGSDEQNCSLCDEMIEYQCINNGSCIPLSYLCDNEEDCEDGSDEKNCSQCHPTDEFACSDGVGCVYMAWRCDGVPECKDMSDEENCEWECEDGMFLCDSSPTCVPNHKRCDAIFDCYDRSDELNCTCDEDVHFTCSDDGSCIFNNLLCDGLSDCNDGSDETNCVSSCPEGRFMCRDRTCVPDTYQCNGRSECHENEDETICVSFMEETVENGGSVSVRVGQERLSLCADRVDFTIATSICKQMGYRRHLSTSTIPISSANITSSSFAVLRSNAIDSNDWMSALVRKSNVCPSNSLAYIECEEYECGTRPALDVSTSRIVGGTEATRGEWPWQVSLAEINNGHSCGASLLSDTLLVTAAHCFEEPTTHELIDDPRLWSASIGMIDLTDESNIISRRVKAIHIHPEYNPPEDDYDIAMVELLRPVDLTDNIQTICLPPPDMQFRPGTECFVTGWGATSENGFGSDVLLEASLPIVTNEVCQEKHQSLAITPRMLCAGFDLGGKDSCQGDSGGPFVCDKGPGKWYLAGVVSFGVGCARPDSPGVYSRVTEYLNFIHQYFPEP
ncbi:transmembrane protease serine 9-like isoform X2 [Glandiceps talaboti]